jgi:hypothetical protein
VIIRAPIISSRVLNCRPGSLSAAAKPFMSTDLRSTHQRAHRCAKATRLSIEMSLTTHGS